MIGSDEDRQQLINGFQDNEDIFLFLLSTKACSMGLNLTKADTVVLLDMDWVIYDLISK